VLSRNLSRRLIGSLVVATVLISLAVAPLLACNITLKADKSIGGIGDTVKIDVTVVLTHRNCPVPISETRFVTTNNIKVVGLAAWIPTGRDTYKTVLSVQLLAAGAGKIEVIRDCIKEGGYAAVSLIVAGEGSALIPVTVDSPPETTAAVVTPTANSNGVNDSKPDMTWAEAFKRAFSQPFIWVYLGLVGFAYFALLSRRRRWRFVSLAFSMVYLGFFLGLCPCAIGAMQNVILHFGDAKAYLAQFIILAIPIVSTLFLGRLYCGWVCPMGAVQQFLYRRDLAIKLPEGLGDKLRRLRFVVLGAIIAAALYTGTAAFAEVDPFKSLFNAQIAPVPTTLLVVILAASIFVFTPWCRFLCPMGAVLSVVGRIARRQVAFKAECKNCGACAKTFCDYQAISPGNPLPVIEQNECARCGECVSRCPRKAMDYSLPEKQAIKPGDDPRHTAAEAMPLPEAT